ncbi:MAG: hypothetical protein FWD49_03255 [Firmicutes bacterium]|nr:hypothetical protein [Bacillota bacterium]
MDVFLKFFYEVMYVLLEKLGDFFGGLWRNFWAIFSIRDYNGILSLYKDDFNGWAWFFTIVFLILLVGFIGLIGFMIVLLVKKYIRVRKKFVEQEEMVLQIDDLNKKVVKLIREKDYLMALKVSQLGLKPGDDVGNGEVAGEKDERFVKLISVDQQYAEGMYVTEHPQDFTLEQLVNDLRNYACKELKLFYTHRIIGLFVAGLATSKIIILEGISGTGKTSLPYAVGKFFAFDTPIVPVQPSWRDKAELVGYLNEFTRRFNETDFLKNVYECKYRETVSLIVLDEMNLARIEYYFAEVLSMLELPNTAEWLLDVVPDNWASDPKLLTGGKIPFPTNVWFVGTANNDDSTFTITDKVYDRATAIPINTKGVAFEPGEYKRYDIKETYLKQLFVEAKEKYIIPEGLFARIAQLDNFVLETFRITFGNRILKQMKDFLPVFAACGGDMIDGLDFFLTTKIFRKFGSLNTSHEQENLQKLILVLTAIFGEKNMQESKEFIQRMIR